MFLNFGFPGRPGPHRPAINGIAFKKPPVAAILNPKNMSTVCNSSCGKENVKCRCTHVVTLTRNAVHQIVLMGLGSGNGFSHPIHIHGYSFYVVKMGFPPYSNETGQLQWVLIFSNCVKKGPKSKKVHGSVDRNGMKNALIARFFRVVLVLFCFS